MNKIIDNLDELKIAVVNAKKVLAYVEIAHDDYIMVELDKIKLIESLGDYNNESYFNQRNYGPFAVDNGDILIINEP